MNVNSEHFLPVSHRKKFRVAYWQSDLCTDEFGRKKLADGVSMYAVIRRGPFDLKSRSNWMIAFGMRTSSILLALFDIFLRYCSFGQIKQL